MYFASVARNGRAILLLDAIDEVVPSNRTRLIESLRELTTVYPALRMGSSN